MHSVQPVNHNGVLIVVANVAAIGRPKMTYRDVEKKSYKLKFSTDLIHICFIWQLICMAMFVSLEVGNVSAQ